MKILKASAFLMTMLFIGLTNHVKSQALDVSTCATMVKRSNGNGQASLAPGDFRPLSSQNNPVAANVVGTQYQLVPFLPSTKTGDIHLKWSSATAITNVPVITRVWLTASGSTNAVLSNIKFGPPSAVVPAAPLYYVDYCFYNNNLPNAGILTVEFSDPQTGIPAFRCSYDLQSNGNATAQTVNCTPTIITQPLSQNLCGASTASFSVAASGATTYQWQVSSDGTNFTNISNGGNYTNATTSNLSIASPTTNDGKYYRVVLGATGCTSVTSTAALLTAKPKPTAAFNTAASFCGFSAKNLGVAFTGTAPFSITYSDGTNTTTLNNITANPYYFSVSPAAATTYTLTSVSDAFCTNSALTGSVATTINATPTVAPSNATACIGNSSFSLSYTSSGSPNRYTITAGTRSLTGFSAVTNGTLSGSPITVSIPTTGISAGTYDFKLSVSNATTGCVSAVMPLTLTINPLPVLSASASSSSVCSGTSLTVTAAPSNLTSYSWTANPTASIASVYNPTVTPTANTTYTVSGTNANGCTATASVSVAISGSSVSVSPSAPTICNGNSTILTATGGSSYSWSPATGLSATAGDVVIASPTTTTTYTVTSSSNSGCSSTANVTVTVNSPVVTVTPSSPTLCAGSSTTLTASGASTYSWTPATGLSATTGAVVTATPTATTTYKVIGTDASGCTVQGSSTVTISAAPVNTATSVSNSYSFCSQGPTSFSLPVNVTTSVTSMTWSYATTQSGPYTTFSSAVSPTGATLTPSSTGASNATLTVGAYSNGGYGGPRFLRLVIVSSTCTYNYDIQLFDTKGSGIAPTPTASKTTVCSGDNVTLDIGTVNSSYTGIQWQSSATLSGTYTNIVGATSSSYTTGALTALTNNFFKVTLTASGNCGYVQATGTTITVAASLTANTVTPATSCTNGSTFLTLTGSAITGGIYQWQRSTTSSTTGFTDLIGATSQDYTLTRNVVPVSTWYRRIASTSTCATNTSTAVVVHAPITNNVITNSATAFCGTATATTINGSTPGGGDGSYVYSWQSSTDGTNFTAIIGANAASYTTVSQNVTTYYKRVVTSGGCGTSTSSAFVITVNANPTVTVTPSSSTLCAGSSATLTASGANSYSWSPSTDLSATTGNSVISTPVANRTYTITGTSTAGCTGTATATVNYTAPPAAPTASTPTPTICSNVASFNLSTAITGASGTEWYTAPVANATYLVAAPTTVSTAGMYYAFNKTGSCYSTSAASVTLSIADVSKPAIAATSFTACSPATANLTALQPAAASGTTLEWHTGNTSGSSLAASASSASTGTYYLFAYSTAGNCYGPASDAVNVTINSLPTATVSGTPAAVCYPGTVNLGSYNTTGNGTYTYQWYSVASNPSPATLVTVPTSVSAGGNYYLYATSAQGCKGSASSALAVTINSKPTAVITAPSSVCASSVISIPGSSDAVSPSYSWQVSADGGNTFSNLSNSGVYTGSSSATLGISNSTGLDGYQYRFAVTSSAGCSTTSDNAIVSVDAATSITTNPTDTTVLVNGTATFRIRTTGSPTVNYQWKLSTNNGSTYSNIADGSQYAGTNTSDLVVLSAPSGFNSYKFKCEISNTCTAATLSSAATLSVNTCTVASAGGTVSSAATVCSGTNSTLLTLSGQTGTILKWQSSGDNFSADINDINNITSTYTAANITSTTSYRAVVQSGGCAGAFSSYATITVNAATVAGNITGDASKCAGTNTTTLTLTGSTGSIFKWQSATAADFSGTVTDISNTTASYAATNLSTTTYYRAVVKSGVCAQANSSYGTVTVFSAPSISSQPASSQLIATGNNVSLTVSGSNIGGYQWTKDDVDITGATTNTLSFTTLTVNDGGVYKLKMTNGVCTATSNSFTVTPSIVLYSKSSGNLNIAANWGVNSDGTGSTPVDFTRDEHTFIVANRAAASTGGNLTIAGTLDLKDATTNIAASSTLTAGVIKRTGTSGVLSGSNTSGLAITGIAGTTNSNLWFAAAGNYLKTLTISNVTTTLNTSLNIAASPASGVVTVKDGGTLVTNNNLTLKSDINGSASVAKVSNGNAYITGDVTVERFIPNNGNRAWRLLAIPTKGSQTIHQSWQEDQAADVDPQTGYGTILTSSSSSWLANGFDEKTPGNSVLEYFSARDSLGALPSTNTPIATTSGYFVYIRGDRSIKQNASTVSINSTTLRTKGPLYMGAQPAITVAANQLAMVGNTYASAIDLRNVITTGGVTATSFYVWDPKVAGTYNLGAFQTLTPDNGEYIITPGGGSYGVSGLAQNTIQSGQAFFVEASETDGTIQLTEDAKTTGSSTVFSPVNHTSKRLITNLYYATDTALILADGALQLFDESFDNAVNKNDAKKVYNFGENFYITRASKDLVVEKRNLLTASDTIYFAMESLKRKAYQLQFSAKELNNNSLVAFLEDSYTKTQTPVNLNGITSYNFSVDANAASSSISRFKIVFKKDNVLPVTITSIKAYQQNQNAVVAWSVTNEEAITGYEVERSTNARDFTKLGSVIATNYPASTGYTWNDMQPVTGNNYYRIISYDKNGTKAYSQVVVLNMAAGTTSIQVYPNPVKNGIVKVQLSNMAAGKASARIISVNGTVLMHKVFSTTGQAQTETIQIGKIPAGNYLLEIIGENGSKLVEKLVIASN